MVRTLLFSLSDCRLVFARIMASIWARLTVFIRRLRPCLSQLSININRDRTYAQAVSNPTRPTTVPQQTSLQRAVAEAKKQDVQLQPGAQHGHLSTAGQLTTISGIPRVHCRSRRSADRLARSLLLGVLEPRISPRSC